jgi:hypothetical protein
LAWNDSSCHRNHFHDYIYEFQLLSWESYSKINQINT